MHFFCTRGFRTPELSKTRQARGPDRGRDGVFARNDGKYDTPAPRVRRAKDDFDGLHHILGDYLEGMSQTQREIIVEEFFEGRKGPTSPRAVVSV